MKKPTAAQLIKKYAVITLGSLIYAASVSLFLDPNNIAPGGVSGIAIIFSSTAPPSCIIITPIG